MSRLRSAEHLKGAGGSPEVSCGNTVWDNTGVAIFTVSRGDQIRKLGCFLHPTTWGVTLTMAKNNNGGSNMVGIRTPAKIMLFCLGKQRDRQKKKKNRQGELILGK